MTQGSFHQSPLTLPRAEANSKKGHVHSYVLFLQLYNQQLVVRITTHTKHFLLNLNLGHLTRVDTLNHITLPQENCGFGGQNLA